MRKVLVIDDELAKTDESIAFKKKYSVDGYEYLFAANKRESFDIIESQEPISIILLDIIFNNMDDANDLKTIENISTEIWPNKREKLAGNEYGLPMLKSLQTEHPEIPVIMLSSKSMPSILIWCWRNGASSYIVKAPEKIELKNDIVRFSRFIQKDLIIGNSMPIKALKEKIKYIVNSDSPVSVLITGESGTGKELVARSIWEKGYRKNGPFVAVNCAAIPESIIESELFGHKKGAFTGALNDRNGKIKSADKGILFLDEIGDLPLTTQVKLLRFLQEKTIYPVGSDKEILTDIQIIAASNKNLEREIKEGKFREDLFYRLNVFNITTPSLREMQEDIALIAEHILKKLISTHYRDKNHIQGFDSETFNILKGYPWPGNVRELENTIEQTLIKTHNKYIVKDTLPEVVSGKSENIFEIDIHENFDMDKYISRMKWNIIKRAYKIESDKGKSGIIDRISSRIGIKNPSDLQRTILKNLKIDCPELKDEIEKYLPYRPKSK